MAMLNVILLCVRLEYFLRSFIASTEQHLNGIHCVVVREVSTTAWLPWLEKSRLLVIGCRYSWVPDVLLQVVFIWAVILLTAC